MNIVVREGEYKHGINVAVPVFEEYDTLDEEQCKEIHQVLSRISEFNIKQVSYAEYKEQKLYDDVCRLNPDFCKRARLYENKRDNIIGLIWDIVDKSDKYWMFGIYHRVNLGGPNKKKLCVDDKCMWVFDLIRKEFEYYRKEGVSTGIVIY